MRKTESIFSLTSSPLRLPWPIGRGSILLVFAFVLSFLTACSGDDSSSTSVDDFSSESVEASSSSVEGSSSSSKESSSSGAMPESSSSPVSSSSAVKSSSSVVAVPCKTETEDNCKYGTLVDERDGQSYRTVEIGTQVWMAENLNYAYLQPTTTLDSSSWCYDNDPVNCETYGRLYLWSAAVDSAALFSEGGKGFGYNVSCIEGQCAPRSQTRGACPVGWHLPSCEEWRTLYECTKWSNRDLKSRKGWKEESAGSDIFGFGAKPSGFAYDDPMIDFYGIGESTEFWATGTYASCQIADFSWEDGNDYVDYPSFSDVMALPARCIKDE